MNEKLTELAKSLGVTVDELWKFLTDGGLQSFANMKVITAIPGLVVAIAAIVILVIAMLASIRTQQDEYYDDDWVLCTTLLVVLIIALIICVTCTISSIIGWLAEPQGMLISMFLNNA